jgi:tetratricopeptide (TPR) repeat protein
LNQLPGEIALTLVNALSLPDQTDGTAPGASLLDAFSFSNTRLLRADRALAALPQTHVTLTLRAYIRNTQHLERLPKDGHDVLGEASDFAARALELAPLSSTTLAVAAMVASQRHEVEFFGNLAERALRADPANPLARSSYSLALATAGRHEQAHAEALRARAAPLSALSPASWANFCAVTAIRARKFEEAQRHSLIAHGYAPDCRPALRFLAALRYRAGDIAGAEQALRKLRAIEPDFSLELMADREYPVASLRATGLTEVTRSQLI